MSDVATIPGQQAAASADDGSRTAPIGRRFTAGDLLVVAFIVGYAVIGMRGMLLRLALLPDDDGPLFYALAFKTPQLFVGDYPIGMPHTQLLTLKLATSVMIWAPAALWRWANVDPYTATWLVTFTQAAAIGISIYVLTVSMTRNRLAAAVAVVFGYVATPWSWAPANYTGGAGWTFLPYPAHLAIGPVLLALACIVRNRSTLALVFLGVAALIHPGLAIFACAIAGLYWLAHAAECRSARALRPLRGLAIVVVIALAPAFWLLATQAGNPLPLAESMAGLRVNQHIWPWGVRGQWGFALLTTALWLAFGTLAWRRRDRFVDNVGRLWLAALGGAILLSLSQVIGAIFEMPTLLNLIGLRSWMWLALLSLPLVADYWVAHLESGNRVATASVVLCLVLPLVTAQYALFWPLALCLGLVDLSQGHLSVLNVPSGEARRRLLLLIAVCVLTGWATAFLLMPLPAPWTNVLWGNSTLPVRAVRIAVLGVAGIAGFVAWIVGRWSARAVEPLRGVGPESPAADPVHLAPASARTVVLRSAATGSQRRVVVCALVVVLYAAGAGWASWRKSQTDADPRSSDAMAVQVQLWARDHTPVSSLFVVPVNGWRTVSQRRMLSPFTRESYAYVASAEAKLHRDRLLRFYGISDEAARARRGTGVSQMELDRFRRFGEDDFLRFARDFAADYLVLPTQYPVTDRTELRLPVAYRNSAYVVYHLDRSLLDIRADQLANALKSVRLDMRSMTAVRGDSTYLLGNGGTRIQVEGPVWGGEGPTAASTAVMTGAETRLTAAPHLVTLPAGSLAMWAKVGDLARPYADLVRVNNGSDLYIFRAADGQFTVCYAGQTAGVTDRAIADREWHHYAFTWKDGEQRFYIDGMLSLSAALPGSKAQSTVFAIGWLGDHNGEQWVGMLARPMTFDRALTADEVGAIYLGSRPSK